VKHDFELDRDDEGRLGDCVYCPTCDQTVWAILEAAEPSRWRTYSLVCEDCSTVLATWNCNDELMALEDGKWTAVPDEPVCEHCGNSGPLHTYDWDNYDRETGPDNGRMEVCADCLEKFAKARSA